MPAASAAHTTEADTRLPFLAAHSDRFAGLYFDVSSCQSCMENKMTRKFLQMGLVSLLLCAMAFGQAETGQITGTVSDPSGAVVPNAKVTVTNVQTNASRSAQSNASGIYSFTNLQPGSYEIAVEGQGFA